MKPGTRWLLLVCLIALPLFSSRLGVPTERELYDLQIQLTRWLHGDPPLASELVLVALDQPSLVAGFTGNHLETVAQRINGTTRVVSEEQLEQFLLPDPDGTLRGIRLYTLEQGSPRWAPYLLDLARLKGVGAEGIQLNEGLVRVGDLTFAVDELGQIYPYFPVPADESALRLREFGAGGVLDLRTSRRRDATRRLEPVSLLSVSEILPRLEGKLVVLGRQTQYATGVELPTPVGKMVSLELYGSALDALLAGHYVVPLGQGWDLVLTALFLVWICVLLPGKGNVNALGWWTVSVVGWLCLHQVLFYKGVFGLRAPALLTAILVLMAHFLLRSRLLAHYLYGFGGHVPVEEEESEIEATIAFTNLPAAIEELESKDLAKANALRAAYSDCLGRITERNGGRVVDLQGDAQMLAFGLSGESNHALCAVVCGLDLVKAVTELLEQQGLDSDDLAVHYGVVTGTVARGQVGAGAYRSVAAIGDTTNTAARLMGKAKKAGKAVLAARRTVESAGPGVAYRDYGEISVKGKQELIPVKEILSVVQSEARPSTVPRLKPPRLPVFFMIGSLLLSVACATVLDLNLPLRLAALDRLTGSQRAADVMWAGLDEASLDYAPWPWPRSWHARVIENCRAAGVKCLFFDMLFDQPTQPGEDEALVTAVQDSPNVVVAAAASADVYSHATFPILIEGLIESDKWGLVNVVRSSTEQDELVRSARWEMRGFRAKNLQQDTSDRVLPGACKTMARVCQSPAVDTLEGHESFLIRWGPPPERFSYYRLLDPDDPIFHELKGSVVVVADGLQGPSDQFDTPRGKKKGGELHCLSIQTCLTEDFLWDLSKSSWADLLSLLFAVATLWVSFRFPGWGSQAVILIVAVSTALGCTVVVAKVASIYLGTAHVLAVPCVLAAAAVLRIVDISSALRSYVPKAVQQRLETDGFAEERTTTGTVLLTDIRGYTSLSEGRAPLEVLGLLNRYHELTVACYQRHGGHLLTYQGDAQIVVFGPLQPVANPVGQALKAAAKLEPLVQQVAREAGLSEDNELRVGAGITTGPVTISLLRAGDQLQYTVLGDPVRRAHKLQSQSDTVGASILLDEASYFSVRDAVQCDQHTDEQGHHFYTPVQ